MPKAFKEVAQGGNWQSTTLQAGDMVIVNVKTVRDVVCIPLRLLECILSKFACCNWLHTHGARALVLPQRGADLCHQCEQDRPDPPHAGYPVVSATSALLLLCRGGGLLLALSIAHEGRRGLRHDTQAWYSCCLLSVVYTSLLVALIIVLLVCCCMVTLQGSVPGWSPQLWGHSPHQVHPSQRRRCRGGGTRVG